MKKQDLTYYEIDLCTGDWSKRKAKNALDLEIVLCNGDCVKTEKEVCALEYKIKTGADSL